MDLGRKKVTVQALAAWLLWQLTGKGATGVEILPQEGTPRCLVSVKLAGGGGFVQEELDGDVWWKLSPKEQERDAKRLRQELERRASA